MMILDPDRYQATDETSPKPASQYGRTCSDSLRHLVGGCARFKRDPHTRLESGHWAAVYHLNRVILGYTNESR
ncbi:hypothetical protein PGT21_009816 [Puccinia graminis f. sp. tritici]|uniref:Uncharacterized protein n=1 Tax=Puccinia graminis f. sp. tritici TaxID=56615 RepID=A0A5B0MTI9_PUCGR|nr:hypothetical protein PGT21_009816 [Puccinia graminis f. sp. tritici]